MKRVLKRIGIVIVLGAVAFGGGIFLMDLIMGNIVGRGDVTCVPDVTNLPCDEATRLFEDEGLYLLVDREEFAPEDSGVVIRQRPEADERVKKGRRIAVVISKGQEWTEVPELTGERVRQARIALSETGLRVGEILRVPNETVEGQIVIASSPVAGTPLMNGTRVHILVSLGPDPSRFLAPSLINKPIEDVRRYLRLFGLSLAGVSYRAEEGAVPGMILEQIPPPGSCIDPGTGIELVVASP